MQGYNVILVYSQDKSKLLVCHRSTEPYKGLYNLVGGKIEKNEDGMHAAYRELEEETGITVSDIRLTHLMDFVYYNEDCVVEAYAGKLRHEVVLKEEKHPLLWQKLESDFFDMNQYAGEGNIGHLREIVKIHEKEALDSVILIDKELSVYSAMQKDAQQLTAWWNDGKVMAHAGFPEGLYTTTEKVKAQIAENNNFQQRMILFHKQDRIGEMSYRIKDDTAEIGIKICESSYQEKGYGTRYLKLLLDHLFLEKQLCRVILDTNLKNLRAQHVYEKIGFIKQAVRMDCWQDQLGQLQSVVDYAMSIARYQEVYLK